MKRYELLCLELLLMHIIYASKVLRHKKVFKVDKDFLQSNIYTNRSQNTLSTFYFNRDERITNKPLGRFLWFRFNSLCPLML